MISFYQPRAIWQIILHSIVKLSIIFVLTKQNWIISSCLSPCYNQYHIKVCCCHCQHKTHWPTWSNSLIQIKQPTTTSEKKIIFSLLIRPVWYCFCIVVVENCIHLHPPYLAVMWRIKTLFSFSSRLTSCAWSVRYFKHWDKQNKTKKIRHFLQVDKVNQKLAKKD